MIERITHGDIHEIRLARPPVNALSPELLEAISDEVRTAPERGARALVLSGGEGIFSAGLDVPVLLGLDRDGLLRALDIFFGTMEALARSTIPVAAAITGHSPAGGAVLALFCDWRVMAEGDYSIGLNEVRIGIPMPSVVAALVGRTVGPRVGESLCVTGRLLPSAEALDLGLVDQLAALDSVVSVARAWCESTIQSPAGALTRTRETMRRDLIDLMTGQRAADVEDLARTWFEPELQETLHALVARLKGN